MKKILLIGLLLSFIFTGCSYQFTQSNPYKSESLIQRDYSASNELLKKADLPYNSKIIMTTIVDINDIENAAPLGRTISEHVSTFLANKGFNVVEMKLRNKIKMKKTIGELVLSRDVNKVIRDVDARALVTGTYSNSASFVYISLKILDAKSGVILAGEDYRIYKTEDIRKLLRD